ncbi:MAG TPA: ParB/RepB/Spo0J family partition protein [Candidatus Saccharimonadales bacterium]|nr:ParB/RepB/Spo0J family partition protein [Candidatus Saccharimonadales bacterium]
MTATPKRGLGRGFDALISQDFDKSLLLSGEDRIEKIAVGEIQPSPLQPRKHFDETALKELSASIKRYGIVQPLVVTPVKDGKYTLIAGERRWRAAQAAKLEVVPAIIRSHAELEQLELALIENVQRVDLSPLEQALSIEKLHQQFNFAYDEIAKRLGKAPSTVINTARLLGLPEAAKDALAAGKISEGHARAILALKGDVERQQYLLETIISQGWSVRQAERFVTSVKQGHKQVETAHARVQTETPATKKLGKKLGTSVTIRRTAHGGKLEIGFKDDGELDRILGLFN